MPITQRGRKIRYDDEQVELVHDAGYASSDSFQVVAADFTPNAAAGTSDAGDSAYLAAIMGNILGSAFTKTGNYCAGVIGAYNVTSTNAATYPVGAVIGEIGDTTTTADGAFVAVLGGDSGTTSATAAFKVMNNNSTAASGFAFALDCQSAAHDGYQPVDSAFYTSGIVRLVEDVCFLVGTATPTDGAAGTGNGVAGPGSLHFNTSDAKLRTNTNTKASPTWTVVGAQTA